MEMAYTHIDNPDKLRLLRSRLAGYGTLCVAYSGGTDSAFLLYVAREVLGEGVMAVLVDSPVLARRDRSEAIAWLEEWGVGYEIVSVDPFSVPEFAANDRLRCYHCKKNNYRQILAAAERHGRTTVADGQNADDAVADDRPGARAARELGVVSPLADCGFTKAEIRACSHALGIPTWDKPSNACLATRLPFGTALTAGRLAVVEAAEELLRSRGMEGCRVRWHDSIARIEAPRQFFDRIINTQEIIAGLKALGFTYITLDLEGFRSGSMN